jgi:hypothetical protein
MTADHNGFPPLADPADAVPFETDEADEDGAPSEAVAAVLQFCQDQGFVSAEYQELALFAVAAIAGPLHDALSEGLEADEPIDGLTAADMQDAVTRLQIAAETLASVDLSDEVDEDDEAEPDEAEAEAEAA